MRIRIAVPDAHISPDVLNAALEATTRANESMLASGEAEPISELIKRGHVKWRPEGFHDGEHFDLGKTVQQRGWGDCDDLAPALAAELRATGRDEGARAIVRKSGPKLWHAVTELSDGRILDPSKAAGMNQYKAIHGFGVMGLMHDGPMLGIKPTGDGRWGSRCDLPISGAESALCGVHIHRDPLEAITGAVEAVSVVGGTSELVDPREIAKALAMQAACAAADPGDVMHALSGHLSHEEVGSFFGSIAHALKKTLPGVASFLPIPGAGLAAQMATHLIPDGHGGHHAVQVPVHEMPGGVSDPGHPQPGGVQVTKSPSGAIVLRF